MEIYEHGTYVWEIYEKYMNKNVGHPIYTWDMWETLGKHVGNPWLYTKDINCLYIYIWKHIQITCPEINGTSVNSKFDHDISEVMISG